jgi:chromosome partitioning protein
MFTAAGESVIAGSSPDDPGITLAYATPELTNIETAVPAEMIGNFFAAIQAQADSFDVCVIDTPTQRGLRVLSGLMASDYVISPTDLGDWSIEGVQNLLKMLSAVSGAGRDPDFLGFLVSRYRGRAQIKKLNEVQRQIGKLMLHVPDGDLGHVPAKITIRTAYEQIATERKPVWEMKGSGGRQAAEEIRGVLSEIEIRMGLGE